MGLVEGARSIANDASWFMGELTAFWERYRAWFSIRNLILCGGALLLLRRSGGTVNINLYNHPPRTDSTGP